MRSEGWGSVVSEGESGNRKKGHTCVPNAKTQHTQDKPRRVSFLTLKNVTIKYTNIFAHFFFFCINIYLFIYYYISFKYANMQLFRSIVYPDADGPPSNRLKTTKDDLSQGNLLYSHLTSKYLFTLSFSNKNIEAS